MMSRPSSPQKTSWILPPPGAKYAVIFMTAHDNAQWQQRAKEAGAVAYLKKPFDEHSLLDAIQLACREEA
jgi:FixJ family two-component response regulator